MCEAAVDMFLRYPHLTPDEILEDVSPTYFLDNIPVVTVPEQAHPNPEQIVAGVAPHSDADSEGHSGESHSHTGTSAWEQEKAAPHSPGSSRKTV